MVTWGGGWRERAKSYDDVIASTDRALAELNRGPPLWAFFVGFCPTQPTFRVLPIFGAHAHG
jgi:hypothetical protein